MPIGSRTTTAVADAAEGEPDTLRAHSAAPSVGPDSGGGGGSGGGPGSGDGGGNGGGGGGDRWGGGVSVLILTKNEEDNIAGCLECCAQFTDDIVVLDSLSTDRTVEIARSHPNVRVVQRTFDTEYKQRNAGLHDVAYKHSWVYICDADERVPTDLQAELHRVAADAPAATGAYRLRYKNMFLGKWIKRSSGYPVWVIRFVRPSRVRYEVRTTNVHPIVEGDIGHLDCHFIHYSFNSGLPRWFAKHNFYSDREALEALAVRAKGLPGRRQLLSPDPMVRRRALKNLSFFLKWRGVFRFLRDYILGRGFLDGSAGLHYCAMISMYEYWIELKIREQVEPWRQATDQRAADRLAAPGDQA